MRTGLVAVGVALAVVGAGVIAAVSVPVSSPPISRTGSLSLDGFDSSNWSSSLFAAVPASSAGLSLLWSSNGPMSVTLSDAEKCDNNSAGWCEVGPSLAGWTDASNGSWAATGPARSLYVLGFLSAGSGSPVNFSAQFNESYRTTGPALPTLLYGLAVAGGGVLIGIGGLVTYLGLFLPTNPLAPADPALEPAGDLDGLDPAAIDEELEFRS
jgi:hypothetical protein